MKRLEKILAQKAAPKLPDIAKLWQFLQGYPKLTFSEKAKGEAKGNFSKIVQKLDLVWKAQKHSSANGIIL